MANPTDWNGRRATAALNQVRTHGARHNLPCWICHTPIDYNCLGHDQTLVSQWAYWGLRPLTMSKNAVWIFSVMGPRLPT